MALARGKQLLRHRQHLQVQQCWERCKNTDVAPQTPSVGCWVHPGADRSEGVDTRASPCSVMLPV